MASSQSSSQGCDSMDYSVCSYCGFCAALDDSSIMSVTVPAPPTPPCITISDDSPTRNNNNPDVIDLTGAVFNPDDTDLFGRFMVYRLKALDSRKRSQVQIKMIQFIYEAEYKEIADVESVS